MKFSIITPNFNQGRFIRDCIESVRAQAGVEWEHIIVDAGSTDETLNVLREYPHLQWTSEPDKGMSDGINKGFLRATGDWVMWLNADDYLLPGALAKVAAHINAHPGKDVVYGEAQFVSEEKQFLRNRREHAFDFNTLLFYGCYIQSTATFLRRDIIQSGQLLDLRYKVCMDFEYYLRLAHSGRQFSFMPEPLAAFRWHGTNTSSTFLQRRREERLEIQRRLLQAKGLQFLGNKPALAVLYRVFQLKRMWLRRRDHSRS